MLARGSIKKGQPKTSQGQDIGYSIADTRLGRHRPCDKSRTGEQTPTPARKKIADLTTSSRESVETPKGRATAVGCEKERWERKRGKRLIVSNEESVLRLRNKKGITRNETQLC